MYSKRIDWCGVVVALFLALSVVAMSVLAFLPFTSQNVCFASSSDGIVEDNLLLRSDLIGVNNFSTSTAGDQLFSSGTPNYYIYNPSGNTLTYSAYHFVNTDTVTNQCRLFFDVSSESFEVGSTYTFTCRLYSSNTTRLRVRNGDGTNVYSAFGGSSTDYYLLSMQFTYTGTSNPRFLIYYIQDMYLDYFKVEKGTEFTGYVPKDYEHYGYQEGYNDAVQKFVDYSNTINGYTIVGSYSMWLQNNYLSDSYFNMTSSFWGANTMSYSISAPLNNNQMTFGSIGSPSLFYGFGNYSGTQPVSITIMNYQRSEGYEFSFLTTASGSNYLCAIPVGLGILYLNADLYFSFDFNDWNSYSLLIVSTDNTYYKLVSITNATSYLNGVPYIALSPYLVSGQYYNFYLCARQPNTAISFTTHNSYFTGINSLSIFYKESSYNVGVNSYQQGYDNGYDVGYSTGYQLGDNAGYNRGVDEYSDYGFYGLIGSAIDVPINAITGLLDFDLLGVNMKAFFLSIFSLAVLIVIVRLIVGGLS